MKNTSTEFNTIAENPFGAKYIHKIIDLTNNTEIKDDIDDFLYSAMINDDDVFTIGNTCSATISFSITNPTVNLNNKEIAVYQGLNVNGTVEYIKLGVFKVLKPKKDRNITKYQCVDRMTYLMNMPYSSNLTFPTTDVKILQEICSQVEISLVQNGLISHSISKSPSGYTKREIIAYMSQLQGKNAIINSDGNLELIWYTDTDYVVDDNKIYYDGISDVNSEIDYEVEYLECTVRSLDGTDETVIKAGSGTNGIKIENPFMTQTILYELANKLVGFTFRGAEFEFLGDFRLEVGDVVSVETNGEVYRVPIMQIEHRSDGGVVTTITSIGETDTENEIDLSAPNVHAMDRYYAELVLINKAMINKLSVDEADIKYLKVTQLEGIEANIENAVIENLEGKFITVEELDAEKARITVLEANSLTSNSAIIKDLQAGVTKTNTLIFGSASGDTIQTSFSNSVIAQLGDAQIESAMIKEISALKITGLDLNTTKFTVHSEDGLSYWEDNTICIHDGVLGTPRIQIGKDGSGDYNVYIWNAQGKLMFDALGLTEDGVVRKIIRNDVVKDDANINATKLNIESLFNVINDETSYMLKSSKIWIDAEKQTLDVSFKVMSSNISGLQNTQASQGADISIIQGQISSKIWQQDITTAIDNLEIGGRNLVPGTSSEWTAITLGQYYMTIVDLDMAELCEKHNLKDGDILTYSVYLKSDSGKNIAARWQKWNSSSDRTGGYSDKLVMNGEGISTVQITVDTSYRRLQLLITNQSHLSISDNTTEYYKCVKLEKGNKATDWTVAPEDIDTNITALNTQYSSIDQTVNSISATVAKHTTQIQQKASTEVLTNVSNNLTLVEANLEGFKTIVSNTYTTKTDFNNLQIGGRNYIHYGKGNVKKGFFVNFDSVTDEYGEVTITSKNNYASKNLKDGFIIHTRDYEVGATIVFSYDIMYTKWDFPEGTSIREWWFGQRYTRQETDSTDTTGSWVSVTQHNLLRVGQNGCELNKWYHVEVVKVIPAQAAAGVGTAEIIQFSNPSDTAATITLRMKNVKIEYGTKATDWTPAPEDIEDSIADVDAKFANYSTTTAMHSAIDQKADSITQAVSALYTTKTEFNNLEIGGKNYLTNSNFINGFDGWSNTSNRYVIDENKLFEGVKSVKISRSGLTANAFSYLWQSYKEIVQPGDTFTASAYYYTDNISEIDSSTPRLYLDFYDADKKELEATSSYISLNLENGKWIRNSLTRVAPEGTVYVEAYICRFTRNGTLWIAKPQLEKSSKATDWAPALEDIQVEATSAKSVATQTANKFNWMVASGTSSLDFTLTDRMAELTAQIINLNGNVKVSGDMLVDGAITAEKLAVDAIKSRNYRADISGSYLNLEDGTFHSKYLSWDEYGEFKAKSGEIGKWVILPGGGLMAETITSKPGTLNRMYLQPFNNTDYDNTWVLSSQYWGIDSNGDLTDEGEAYWCITGGGDFYTAGNIECNTFLEDFETINNILYSETQVGTSDGSTDYCYWIQPCTELTNINTKILFGGYRGSSSEVGWSPLWYINLIGEARFDVVSATQYNNVSDKNKKHDIVDLNEQQCIDVICSLNPVSFKFNNTEYQRNHWGFVAQDVENALDRLNISWQDFAVVDKTLHKTETMPGEKAQNSEETYDYYLRYEAFIAPMVAMEQNHEKRIQQLENDLAVANALIQSLLLQQSSV